MNTVQLATKIVVPAPKVVLIKIDSKLTGFTGTGMQHNKA
jgi:hypothetical protein